MMKKCVYVLLCLLPIAAAVPVFSQQGSVPQKQRERGNQSTKSAQRNAGEVKFQQNCSRCHNAPESLPPRISGTVVRHMRVRASLSKKDAEDILQFLNPR